MEKNKELVMDMLEAYNDRDFDRCATFFADDFVYHSDSTVTGSSGRMERMEDMVDAFDITLRLHHLFAEGEQVVYHAQVTGKHIGTYHDIAPTLKYIDVQSIGIVKIRDGKITDEWEILEESKLKQQLKGR
jgi:steroid delta-isomerase-like uncharacterized protein